MRTYITEYKVIITYPSKSRASRVPDYQYLTLNKQPRADSSTRRRAY